MSWSNLALWNAQIALLAGAAAALAALFRLRPAPARLLYWQVLLAVCLALPLLQPWQRRTVVLPAVAAAPPAVSPAAAPASPAAPLPRPFEWPVAVAALLAAGVVLRVGWFALGLARLARYRRAARPFDPLPAPLEEARRRIGVYPEMGLSDEVAGPVTFGFRDPVILFPAHFPALDPGVQFSVACHELLHVRRRDWLFTAVEELVRAVFWFHPAVWWMLGQIQLSREQSVDREVVEISQARERYVDALLALSGTARQLDLAPAPLFLRRRHLTARVAAILKETDMSRKRMWSSLAACAGVLLVAGWLVCGSLPLRATPQVAADPPGVTVTGAGRMLHRTPVEYPAEARAKSIEGTVVLAVQVAADGTVADASVIGGPMELRRAALASVLGWHFMREAAGSRQVSVEFKLPAPGVSPGLGGGIGSGSGGGVGSGKGGGFGPGEGSGVGGGVFRVGGGVNTPRLQRVEPGASVPPPPPPPPSPPGGLPRTVLGTTVNVNDFTSEIDRKVTGIEIQGLSPEAAEELRGRLPVHVGDTFKFDTLRDTMRRVDETLKEFDSHLVVNLVGVLSRRIGPDGNPVPPDNMDMILRISPAGSAQFPAATVPGPPPALPAPPPGVQRIRVGGAVQAPKLKNSPTPVYPDLARQARISGVVRLNALIGTDGRIVNLSVISGHPLLVPAAMEAARQYEYVPTLLNGNPAEVVTQVDVNFTLNQ